MSRSRAAVPLALALALAAAPVGSADDKEKLKKPRLDLRATPRFAFSPVTVFLTAELMGGDNVEDLYCPELEWDWDDGGKSVHEADCPPWEAGKTEIQRRFTAEHTYPRSGAYNVSVTMRRSNKSIAKASVRVQVKPGAGDRTLEN
jgi:hypothetical protein